MPALIPLDRQKTNWPLVLKKLWIIKTFHNIYLQDNYHFKDLNIRKNVLIFRIRIKNASNYNSQLKNPQKKESKLDQNSNTDLAPKRAIQHSWSADRHIKSADWPKLLARLRDSLIEIRPIFYDFLEIKTHSNLYLISFFKHPNLYK